MKGLPDYYILCGICGVGKTHLRENSFLATLPVIDMQDSPRENFSLKCKWLIDKIKTTPTPCVIEGIFAPATPSKQLLFRLMKDKNHLFITLKQPLNQVLPRIPKEETGRRQLAAHYSNKF